MYLHNVIIKFYNDISGTKEKIVLAPYLDYANAETFTWESDIPANTSIKTTISKSGMMLYNVYIKVIPGPTWLVILINSTRIQTKYISSSSSNRDTICVPVRKGDVLCVYNDSSNKVNIVSENGGANYYTIIPYVNQ